MKKIYENTLNCERTVEVEFIIEMMNRYSNDWDYILDVGGIPTSEDLNSKLLEYLNSKNIYYKVCDFIGGDYRGDFVKYDFDKEKFDIIIFLSSLEHFPQCTESDKIYRKDYDKEGFKKALSILEDNGFIFLTVPFGKHCWQEYHQNYDFKGILELTKEAKMIERYTYKLIDNKWYLTPPNQMLDVIYTDKAYGVGCFVFIN